MRFALVIVAAGVLALGVAALRGGGGHDAKHAYHDYDANFQTLIAQLQSACGGAARAAKHEDNVVPKKPKKPVRHEDRPPPPPPPHEG